MKRSTSLTIAGIIIGSFLGSSMGIAAFGGAVNAAWVFGPLGGFIGWLISSTLTKGTSETKDVTPQTPENTLGAVLNSILIFLAFLWNTHIALIEKLGLLDAFVRQPLLFLGLCIIISLFFPPFLVAYFVCWVAATHFKASEDTQYKAQIQ